METSRYPQTINIEKWEKYLDREITQEEHEILKNLKNEREINEKISKLTYKEKQVYLLKNYNYKKEKNEDELVNILNYYKCSNNNKLFKRGIGNLMYIYKEYENMFNDEYTMDENYKGEFDVLCKNISENINYYDDNGYVFLLKFISLIYGIKIILIEGTKISVYKYEYEYENEYENENEIIKRIFIGFINNRFVPLSLEKNKEKILDARKMFSQWANNQEKYKNKQNKKHINTYQK
jgi:hypothetical protein